MNYKIESKEIFDCCIKEDAEQSARSLIISILEFSQCAGINLSDVNQLLYDMIDEIDYPDEKKEIEDTISEIYSGGIFDS